MIKSFLVLLVSTLCFNSYAQDYFIVGNDTTFCSDLSYSTTAQGYLKKIQYTDSDGKTVLIKGRKKVPDVATFYQDGVFIDKTPLKAHKPKSYIRYTERAVDGKLKIYLAHQGYNSNVRMGHNGKLEMGGPTGTYRFFLKMPDGTFYKINKKKNIKKYIKPYLLQCSAFTEQYQGDFSTKEEEFMEMIRLYNSICD